MKLNIGERLNLGALLPTQVSLADHRILRELRDSLGVSEQEYLDYEIVQHKDANGNVSSIQWNVGKEAADIAIGPRALEIITDHLKMLDENNVAVSASALELYDKFLPVSVEELKDGA
jgi:hypothetical protein